MSLERSKRMGEQVTIIPAAISSQDIGLILQTIICNAQRCK